MRFFIAWIELEQDALPLFSRKSAQRLLSVGSVELMSSEEVEHIAKPNATLGRLDLKVRKIRD
jgi:hypothetical protein